MPCDTLVRALGGLGVFVALTAGMPAALTVAPRALAGTRARVAALAGLSVGGGVAGAALTYWLEPACVALREEAQAQK